MSNYENIRVVCRFRPPNKFEEENSELSTIKIRKNQTIECEDPEFDPKNKNISFTFDHIFNMNDD
jgi:hypothetical protein